MSQTPKVESNFSFYVTLQSGGLNVLARKRVYNVYTASDGATTRYQVSKEDRTFFYPLQKIAIEELKQFRKDNVSSFVLKLGNDFWYARIPKHISFGYSDILGKHQCCTNGQTLCRRLSSASDDKGGCAKVRAHSKGIENFPWIKSGYETFGMTSNNNVFVVLACDHYEEIKDKSNIDSVKERTALLEDLNSWDHDLDFFSPSIVKRSSKRLTTE